MNQNELFPSITERAIVREDKTMRAVKFLSRIASNAERTRLASMIAAIAGITHLWGVSPNDAKTIPPSRPISPSYPGIFRRKRDPHRRRAG